ncbi:MAG: hypothetical protein IJS89_04320, partial [Bacteroidaceae bacterium]|nr:hypothetical protein [Bacteroidaceae bacterium]
HFLTEEGALPTLTKREALAVNHWIPFTEEEVGAQERFASHFMSDLLRQPLNIPRSGTDGAPSLFDSHTASAERMHQSAAPPTPLQAMSREAQAVMQAGCALWRYYHEQRGAAPDASFYDIRLHFQGTKTTKSGKVQMNPDSADAEYTRLIGLLREAQKELAAHIEPKVYLYGFLKQ